MADFGIKPDIALGVKPPAVMSLGDMLNVARGAQAYQQALQLNPVELEKAKAEISAKAAKEYTCKICKSIINSM